MPKAIDGITEPRFHTMHSNRERMTSGIVAGNDDTDNYRENSGQ